MATRDVQFVSKNRNYVSIERFNNKVKELEKRGYKLVKQTKFILTYLKE